MSVFENQQSEDSGVSLSLPRSPADRQKLKTMISEATYCLQRVDDEKAAIKDIIDVINEDFQLSKKHVRRLINTLYKQNYNDRLAEEEEFEYLYEGLFTSSKVTKEEEAELKAFLNEKVTHLDEDEPENAPDLPFDT